MFNSKSPISANQNLETKKIRKFQISNPKKFSTFPSPLCWSTAPSPPPRRWITNQLVRASVIQVSVCHQAVRGWSIWTGECRTKCCWQNCRIVSGWMLYAYITGWVQCLDSLEKRLEIERSFFRTGKVILLQGLGKSGLAASCNVWTGWVLQLRRKCYKM